jgi:hypothetical protein
VNVYVSALGVLQEHIESGFKQRIPIENVGFKTVDGVETHILVCVVCSERLGAIGVKCAIDDVTDTVFLYEPRLVQITSWAKKDAGVY